MIYLMILLLGTVISTAQQRYNVAMEVDGRLREVIVQVPSGEVPSGGYPVVFMLHGTSGDGEKFYNISGWKELGESRKFITCFPSSLQWCILKDDVSSGDQNPHQTTKWVNGDLLSVACDDQDFIDDVSFFRAMVDSLKKLQPIDARRIYASGFSNGSAMTSKLMIEASDIFAAFASSSGSLHSLDSATAMPPRPYWFIFGTHDDRYYEPVGRDSLSFSDTTFFMFRGLTGRFLQVMQLEQDHEKDSNNVAITYTYSRSQSGGYPTLFRQSLLNKQTHEYPNGTNHPFDAPRLFWQFFTQYSLPTTVTEAQQHEGRIYPNPANAQLTIELDQLSQGSQEITIVDMFGRVMMRGQQQTTTQTLDVSSLSVGIYWLNIGSSKQTLIIAR